MTTEQQEELLKYIKTQVGKRVFRLEQILGLDHWPTNTPATRLSRIEETANQLLDSTANLHATHYLEVSRLMKLEAQVREIENEKRIQMAQTIIEVENSGNKLNNLIWMAVMMIGALSFSVFLREARRS